MRFLTDFADQAVALPVALGIAIWLAAAGWRRGAALWLASLAGAFGAIAVLKLGSLGCGPGPWALASPSGHTASAVFVYGGLAGLAARLRPGWTMAAGLALAILFGTTRVALHVHSVADAVAGTAAGLAALAVFAGCALPPPAAIRPGRAVLAFAAVAAALHGTHLNWEPALRMTAGRWGCLGF